ncbi:MAG: M20 family metallopeptidase [Alphaproteobacteria bacterium]|jgi:acetylornithine deacetylase/succinyl-diaminopimelate desuccinylase-like protein|nr:M20 family metallopeptidase [Alphaproteobacteria bacterium]
MSRQNAIDRALAYFDDGRYFDDLARRVAIPTESQNPDRVPDLYRYLSDEMQPAFEVMGYTCQTYDNPLEGKGPVLLATRTEDDSPPTILGYGHGDVVRGQEGQWIDDLDPWTIEARGDKVYGRGVADNKGQHSAHMAALACVLEERDHLGFNHKFMIETGEENGSAGVNDIVEANKVDFAADFYLASDGPRIDVAKANISCGNRGAVNFDLVCELREGGHHSGNWGGLLANPGIILTHAISTIVSERGQILVKDLLPEPIPNSVRVALRDVERKAGDDAPEIDEWWGEPGLTGPEKVYGWNTFEVLAFKVGNPDRPVNAVPPKAWAHCQIRFVVGSDYERFTDAIQKHLDENGFGMVKVMPPPEGNTGLFKASRTDPDHPWPSYIAEAITRTTGEKTVKMPNSGGSICNYIFQDTLGLPLCWIPHSYVGCSQHAPNEHILKSVTREAMAIMAGVYWDLGDPATSPPVPAATKG